MICVDSVNGCALPVPGKGGMIGSSRNACFVPLLPLFQASVVFISEMRILEHSEWFASTP